MRCPRSMLIQGVSCATVIAKVVVRSSMAWLAGNRVVLPPATLEAVDDATAVLPFRLTVLKGAGGGGIFGEGGLGLGG